MRTLFLLCLIFLGSGHLFAQDIKVDIGKINEKYASLKNFSSEMIYSAYESYSRIKLQSTLSGKIVKSGDNLYSKVGTTETITNKHYLVMIDNEDKMIVVDNNQTFDPQNLVYSPDSFLKICQSYKLHINTPQIRSYIFHFDEGISQYEMVEIFFNPQTYLFTQISLFYNETENETETGKIITYKPVLDIKYRNTLLNLNIPSDLFSEEKYVQINNDGTLKLKPAYAKYQLVTQKVIKK